MLVSYTSHLRFYYVAPVIPGAFFLPIGLLITGWTAQARVHWIAPDIVSVVVQSAPSLLSSSLQGFFFVGAGTMSVFYGMQAYIIDSFPLYAASGEL